MVAQYARTGARPICRASKVGIFRNAKAPIKKYAHAAARTLNALSEKKAMLAANRNVDTLARRIEIPCFVARPDGGALPKTAVHKELANKTRWPFESVHGVHTQ